MDKDLYTLILTRGNREVIHVLLLTQDERDLLRILLNVYADIPRIADWSLTLVPRDPDPLDFRDAVREIVTFGADA